MCVSNRVITCISQMQSLNVRQICRTRSKQNARHCLPVHLSFWRNYLFCSLNPFWQNDFIFTIKVQFDELVIWRNDQHPAFTILLGKGVNESCQKTTELTGWKGSENNVKVTGVKVLVCMEMSCLNACVWQISKV